VAGEPKDLMGEVPNIHHVEWMRTMIAYLRDCYKGGGIYTVDSRIAVYGARTNVDISVQADLVISSLDGFQRLIEVNAGKTLSSRAERESDAEIINRMFPID
jgi:hypothetical protein